MDYIALDVHKRYTFASVERPNGIRPFEARLEHRHGAIREFLRCFTPGSPVAVETVGNWYWIVDEIEEAGFAPRLVHARKAKLLMGLSSKTDKLDARGLNLLQRNGTLPAVWIPPRELRDKRELPRSRMTLSNLRAKLKNRIHATLAKYGLRIEDASDIFAPGARPQLLEVFRELPENTRFATEILLEEIDRLTESIERFEARMREVCEETPEVKLLQTIPGIGFILAVVIALEVGTVDRFPDSESFTCYAGTTPRVHSSGGKTRHGHTRADVNRYLKWAFVEAANSICRHRKSHPERHVTQLYERIRRHSRHGPAAGAVARSLAESAYWMLKKKEPYWDRTIAQGGGTKKKAARPGRAKRERAMNPKRFVL